jgi:pSer/pThr/pTyr-binding forkhead associated (FHA) protein
MAQANAQLIVVTGPDEGRTVALSGQELVVGRSAGCQLALTEQYISREHVRLSLGDDGVMLEVLSTRGVEIDGRTHKRGQVILLATGDVVTVGVETKLFFVDRGDDAGVALAQWKVQHPAAAAPPVKVAKAPAAPPAPPRVPAPPPAFAAMKPSAVMETSSGHPATAPVQTGLARRHKLMFGLGIYGLAMVVLVVVLVLLPDSPAPRRQRPKVLSQAQIEKILKSDESVPAQDSEKAVESLEAARRWYQVGRANVASRYNCIRQYKLYKAYSGRASFEDPADQARFDERLGELVEELLPIYDDACNAAVQERWHQALQGFSKSRDLVDDQSNPFNFNVLRHIDYVKAQVEAQKRSKRQFLGE